VTDEDVSLVDDFVAKYKVEHPLVILSSSELEELIGVSGFPTSAVFSKGELAWTGHPSSAGSAIDDALGDADKGSVYPKKLKKVREQMLDGDHADALKDLKKLMEKGLEGRDAEWAQRIEEYMLATCDRDFASAKEELQAGLVYRAVRRIEGYATKDSAFPQAVEIASWLAEREADPNFKKEMAGGELFEEALVLEKAGEYVDAFKTYKKAAKKGAGARIEQVAVDAAGTLVTDRKTGYKDGCPNCDGGTKSACAKHFEDLEI
jgi:hypothetical protein